MQKACVYTRTVSPASRKAGGHAPARACCRSLHPRWSRAQLSRRRTRGARTWTRPPSPGPAPAVLCPGHHAGFPCFRSPRSGPVSSSVSRDVPSFRRPGSFPLPPPPHVDRRLEGVSGLPRPGHSSLGPPTPRDEDTLRWGQGPPLATEPERIEGHLNPACRRRKRL